VEADELRGGELGGATRGRTARELGRLEHAFLELAKHLQNMIFLGLRRQVQA
jgi:hypothetical protein